MKGLHQKQSNNLKDLIKWGGDYLNRKKVHNPHHMAELIAEYVTGKGRIHFYLEPRLYLTQEEEHLFRKSTRRCGRKIPLAYVTGEQYFMGHRLLVKPGVFIPRPETETLVEQALYFLRKITEKKPEQSIMVIDMGTGSGNIPISIATRINNAFIYAIDVSPLALTVAKNNARAPGVSHRVQVLLGDLFAPLQDRGLEGKVDLVISNPPYVEREQMNHLPKEVQKEPDFTLNGGIRGLSLYEKIIPACPQWLKRNGKLMLEVGYNQAEKVAQIIHKTKAYQSPPHIFYDLQGVARVIVAQKK